MSSPFTPASNRATLPETERAMQQANPSNVPETKTRRRQSLALPTTKLSVPEIPGYVCHWFRGDPVRIRQAQAAGYEFVKRGEVELGALGFANDPEGDGNSDLGTNVSVSSGDADGLFLMKLRKELWEEDEQALFEHHEAIAAQLRGSTGIVKPGLDNEHRYSRGDSSQRNLFIPRIRRT